MSISKIGLYRLTSLAVVVVLACRPDASQTAQPESVTQVSPTENTPSETFEQPVEETPPSASESEMSEAEKKQRMVEDRIEKFESLAKEELVRWTPELRETAAKLASKKYSSMDAAIKAALASPHRSTGNSDRDQFRHPLETVKFFGIKPTHTVIELGAGAGWYTELLAPALLQSGKLIIASADPNGPADSMGRAYATRIKLFLEKSPELYGKVETRIIYPPEAIELGPEGSVDFVMAAREMHNWVEKDHQGAYLKAIHQVLKPKGHFAVVQHRAAEGANPQESVKLGYLPEAWLVEQIEAAGFKLKKKSEINANPKDRKNYEKGVWTLPPALIEGENNRQEYLDIGESDRSTLLFVKQG